MDCAFKMHMLINAMHIQHFHVIKEFKQQNEAIC